MLGYDEHYDEFCDLALFNSIYFVVLLWFNYVCYIILKLICASFLIQIWFSVTEIEKSFVWIDLTIIVKSCMQS